jgi:hypothetical protein
MLAATTGAQPLGAPAPLASAPPILPSAGKPGDNYPPEVTTRITKLACLDHATSLVGGLLAGAGPEAFEEAVTLVETAAKQFYQQARAHEDVSGGQVADQGQIVPSATTPAEVAAQLPPGTVQVGAPAAAEAQDAAAEAPDVIQWD